MEFFLGEWGRSRDCTWEDVQHGSRGSAHGTMRQDEMRRVLGYVKVGDGF